MVLAGQTRLAGSALRMDEAISNVMRMTGISLVEAISMATRNPARVGRIAGRQRGSRRVNVRIWCYSVTMRKPRRLKSCKRSWAARPFTTRLIDESPLQAGSDTSLLNNIGCAILLPELCPDDFTDTVT